MSLLLYDMFIGLILIMCYQAGVRSMLNQVSINTLFIRYDVFATDLYG